MNRLNAHFSNLNMPLSNRFKKIRNTAFAAAYSEKSTYNADSWGTEFIFALPPNDVDAFQAYCSFIGLKKESIFVNVDYPGINNAKLVRKKDKLSFIAAYKVCSYFIFDTLFLLKQTVFLGF